MSVLQDIRSKYQSGSPLMRLIMVNIGVFIILLLLKLITNLSFQQNIFSTIVFDWLGFSLDGLSFIYKPWTLLTYMFIHDLAGIFHLLWNMLFLYWFGLIVEDFIGKSKTLPIYILGGLGGALFALILNSIFHFSHATPLIGASGAVYGIMLAAVTIAPNYAFHLIFLGPIQIKYIAGFKILMDVLSISEFENMGGHFCHLGGALIGFFYIYFLRKGTDIGIFIQKIALHLEDWNKPKTNMKVIYKKEYSAQTTIHPSQKQQKLDEILDKISTSGYENLSKEEKEFLFKASKD